MAIFGGGLHDMMRRLVENKQRKRYGTTGTEYRAGETYRTDSPGYLEALRTGMGLGAQREEAFTMGFLDPMQKRAYETLYGPGGEGGGAVEAYREKIADPEGARLAALTAAQGALDEIYKAGGQFQKGAEASEGSIIRRGWGPKSGFQQNFLNQAHRAGAMQAGLASQAASTDWIKTMLGLEGQEVGVERAMMMDAIESMGAMLQTQEQRWLAEGRGIKKQKKGMFGLGLGPF